MDKMMWGLILVDIVIGTAAVYMRDNIIVLISAIAMLVLLNIFILSTIHRAIRFLRDNFTRIVNGQLNVNIKKSNIDAINQVGNRINEYLEKIRKLVGEYINSSEITDFEAGNMKIQTENLRITAGEIASTTQGIAEAVNSQAESTGKVSNNMEVFGQGVEEIFENANLSLKVAKESKEIVEESFETFRETFKKVEEIKDYNDKVLSDMVELDKSIRHIFTITEAVEAIASQTHLLSLNASIEAARAGEAGRGFAVVAGEVSKLADDSSASAKKIKDLVDNIIGEIDRLTSNIKIQTDVIGNNVTYAKKALDKADAINEAVDGNRKAAEAIVTMTAKQKEKIEDIKTATQTIYEMTEQNAAVSEEITASTQEQLSIIETMYNSVLILNNAIQYSNSIVENFTTGFRITDDIQEKIEKTKEMLTKIGKQEEIAGMEEPELVSYLEKERKTLPYIELMAYINKSGHLVGATVDLPQELRDRSARPYFVNAMKGETFISKEYVSSFTNNYNISVSVPLYKNGIIAGVILADINVNEN